MGPLTTLIGVGAIIAINVACSKGDTKEEKMANLLKSIEKNKKK